MSMGVPHKDRTQFPGDCINYTQCEWKMCKIRNLHQIIIIFVQ